MKAGDILKIQYCLGLEQKWQFAPVHRLQFVVDEVWNTFESHEGHGHWRRWKFIVQSKLRH